MSKINKIWQRRATHNLWTWHCSTTTSVNRSTIWTKKMWSYRRRSNSRIRKYLLSRTMCMRPGSRSKTDKRAIQLYWTRPTSMSRKLSRWSYKCANWRRGLNWRKSSVMSFRALSKRPTSNWTLPRLNHWKIKMIFRESYKGRSRIRILRLGHWTIVWTIRGSWSKLCRGRSVNCIKKSLWERVKSNRWEISSNLFRMKGNN